MRIAGRHAPLSRPAIVRIAEGVLAAERRVAELSISFVGREGIRRLNHRWLGRNDLTDVIAFPLDLPGGRLAGDIYICRWVAAREARERSIPVRQELARLIVHGVLHVLGYEHPDGERRTGSAMWKRQERLVRRLA